MRLTVKEAALRACVCEAVVRGWLKEGLPHLRLGAKGKRGKIMIQADELDAWLAGFKVVSELPQPSKRPPIAPKSGFKHIKF